MLFKHINQAGIQDKPVFDGFSPTFTEFSFSESGQTLHVGEHALGLVEGPYQILSLGQVNGYLTAD